MIEEEENTLDSEKEETRSEENVINTMPNNNISKEINGSKESNVESTEVSKDKAQES